MMDSWYGFDCLQSPKHVDQMLSGALLDIDATLLLDDWYEGEVELLLREISASPFLFTHKFMKNVNNTLFSTLSQTLTILLGEINVCPTTLSGFHFQNIGSTLI